MKSIRSFPSGFWANRLPLQAQHHPDNDTDGNSNRNTYSNRYADSDATGSTYAGWRSMGIPDDFCGECNRPTQSGEDRRAVMESVSTIEAPNLCHVVAG
ncbi:MAG: hypothetical protein ACREFF_03100 [Candidatus Udaeobacter sp.]